MIRAGLFVLMLLCHWCAMAGPGAHGPNGEHLDAPATHVTGASTTKLETHSEAFELVAEMQSDGLVIFIDRYDSNEPVLNVQLEVESGTLKANAHYRQAQGDYVLQDSALLTQLKQVGQHALIFTLVAGEEADLLEASLVIPKLAQTPAPQSINLGWLGLLPVLLVGIWLLRKGAKHV